MNKVMWFIEQIIEVLATLFALFGCFIFLLLIGVLRQDSIVLITRNQELKDVVETTFTAQEEAKELGSNYLYFNFN